MVRSSGFGSIIRDKRSNSSSLSLWLQCFILTKPLTISRRNILQQARSKTLSRSSSVCKLAISRSFSLPSQGSFHLSLAVLFSIGHAGIFCLTRWSSQIHTKFHVLDATRDKEQKEIFGYKTITFYGRIFQFFHLISSLKVKVIILIL